MHIPTNKFNMRGYIGLAAGQTVGEWGSLCGKEPLTEAQSKLLEFIFSGFCSRGISALEMPSCTFIGRMRVTP